VVEQLRLETQMETASVVMELLHQFLDLVSLMPVAVAVEQIPVVAVLPRMVVMVVAV